MRLGIGSAAILFSIHLLCKFRLTTDQTAHYFQIFFPTVETSVTSKEREKETIYFRSWEENFTFITKCWK